MNKKKWLYVVIIIILAVPTLFLYFGFNGNPIGKQISKYTLDKYLQETYPESEFIVDKPVYSFKDSGYYFNVIKTGESTNSEYEFIVTGVFGTHVYSDGIYYANLDEVLMEKLGHEAGEELKVVLERHVPEIRSIYVQMQILKGTYDADTVWDKHFRAETPMAINITTDARQQSSEDVFNAAEKIQKVLDDEQYDYDYVVINANAPHPDDKEWIVKYFISFDKGKTINIKDVGEGNKQHFEESDE